MNLAHLSDQEIKETLVLKERLELLKVLVEILADQPDELLEQSDLGLALRVGANRKGVVQKRGQRA